MNHYTLATCENLMQQYIEADGFCEEVEEGTLGLGLVICYGDGLKYAVIHEVYETTWTSTHTIQFYDELPTKYQDMLNAA